MSTAQKQGYRTNMNNFESDIDHVGLSEESSTELNQGGEYDPYNPSYDVGINVEQGTNNTNWDNIDVNTPLGNNLSPVFRSEMTLVDATYLSHVHEHGRALGFKEVGWYGIMRADAPGFTADDKYIMELALDYFNKVYDTGKAYFTLGGIVEDVDGGRSERVPYKEVSIPEVSYKYNYLE